MMPPEVYRQANLRYTSGGFLLRVIDSTHSKALTYTSFSFSKLEVTIVWSRILTTPYNGTHF